MGEALKPCVECGALMKVQRTEGPFARKFCGEACKTTAGGIRNGRRRAGCKTYVRRALRDYAAKVRHQRAVLMAWCEANGVPFDRAEFEEGAVA